MYQEIPSHNTRVLEQAREYYTQQMLADKLGYSARQIARWESGETPIPRTAQLALAGILGSRTAGPLRKNDFTFIDLFAGIGGIRLGFESQGGQCVYTSEWDSYARKTYMANFPDSHEIDGDITKVNARDIPDHDVLLAGFPCQPFSIAGASKKNSLGVPHGFACKTQGTLFFDVARIIQTKRPKAFLLENVKNLMSHDKGHTFAVIRETLEKELGYKIFYRIIDGKHFVPQHRERIIIVGFDGTTDFSWEHIPLPSLDGRSPKMKSVLHYENGTEADTDAGRYIDPVTGKVNSRYVLSDKLWAYLQAYAEKHRAKGNGFGCSVVTPEDTSRTLSARYYKDGSEILISRGEGLNPRRLTPRECARLMGFPEEFNIVVSDTRAYKQFGNSVVVPVIRHVAEIMKPCIMQLKERHEPCMQQGILSFAQ